MFRNLELEIFRTGLSKKEIAAALDMTYNTFLLKLSGKAYFTLDEAMKLKDLLKTDLSIEELFDRNAA